MEGVFMSVAGTTLAVLDRDGSPGFYGTSPATRSSGTRKAAESGIDYPPMAATLK
jgi:hypothetical protein